MEREGSKPVWTVRIKRWLIFWWQIAVNRTLAPFSDQLALLQLLAFPIFLYLVFLASGVEAVSNEIINSWAALQALLYAFPLFILWNVISAAFSVAQEEKKQGQWFGTAFVYHEPLLIAKYRVTDADIGHLHSFKVTPAEKGGSVELQVEISGFEKQRIKVDIVVEEIKNMVPPWENVGRGNIYSLLVVPKHKTFLAYPVMPMTATCRVPPLSRVKLGIGWSRGVARDAEQ